jgi:hypothetical protein
VINQLPIGGVILTAFCLTKPFSYNGKKCRRFFLESLPHPVQGLVFKGQGTHAAHDEVGQWENQIGIGARFSGTTGTGFEKLIFVLFQESNHMADKLNDQKQ